MWALVVVGKKWRRRREAWCGSGKGWGCMTILHSCKRVKVQGMCTQCLCWIPGFWLQIHQHHHQAQDLWVWIASGFCWSLCRIWIRVCETVVLAYSSFMALPSLSFHTSSPRYTQFFLPSLQIAKHMQTHAKHIPFSSCCFLRCLVTTTSIWPSSFYLSLDSGVFFVYWILQWKIDELCFEHDTEPYAQERDAQIKVHISSCRRRYLFSDLQMKWFDDDPDHQRNVWSQICDIARRWFTDDLNTSGLMGVISDYQL